jgi:replicative DNA helicase
MTQGIYSFPQSGFAPDPSIDRLPPCNIEAEEAVLGGILLDPNAIHRIKDRLKPEHFYVTAHKDIYQTCLRLSNKQQPTDLLSVTSWLSDHNILTKVGGRNKLANVVSGSVSSVNIDAMAEIVIKKSNRRDTMRLAQQMINYAYDEELELEDIHSLIGKKINSIFDTPITQTKEQRQAWEHNRLLQEVKNIFTTCAEPSLRLFRLKCLADENRSVSMNFLELLYLKSLTAQCSKLLNYEELKELAGSTVREWLLNGLVPKSTTILLASDGGVGKTKLAYGIGKVLIQGDKFGQFYATGEKRKILYYQGDESPGDMLQALEALGYSESDINKYVRVRFGWSAENMPTLIQDVSEFKPDVVLIDSLSTANKYSVYQESQMEYSRPILEMSGLATEHKTTFIIIHHTNKDGGVRGTTAIRNAVSEVWTLSKDKSPDASPHDRILEINKSRSRSSGNKYRLLFNPEDLSFTFLQEETDQNFNAAEQTAKEQLLEFFAANRNFRYTTEELTHRTGFSKGHLRKCLVGLSADGLISVQRRPGQANVYFLVMEGDHPNPGGDHPMITPDFLSKSPETVAMTGLQIQPNEYVGKSVITHDHRRSPDDHPMITPHDHLTESYTVSDTAEGDHPVEKKDPEKKSEESKFEKNNGGFSRSRDHLRPEPSLSKDSLGDHGGDHGGDHQVNIPDHDHPMITPKIEEGRVYWSRSLNKQVKVIKVYASVKKADCHVAGDAIAKPRLAFSDLLLSPPALTPGDKVTVLEGEHRGQELLVSSVDGDNIWLKKQSQKFAPPMSNKGQPYKANQLRR